MADLKTTYLGLELNSPLVISSIPLNKNIDNILQMEEMGAGAVILPSLFEEQLRLEEAGLEWYRDKEGFTKPKRLTDIPDLREYNQGSAGYLATLYEVKKRTNMPIIGSLNGSSRGGWLSTARLLEGTGADAIELNIYNLPTAEYVGAEEIESSYVRLVEAIKKEVDLPIAIKMNPYFSSIPNVAKQLKEAGADALVFFNRFYQPDFNLETEEAEPVINYSLPEELLLRLRWVAIVHGRVDVEMGVTGGVYSGLGILKAIYAGANVAMMASAVLTYGIEHIKTVLEEVDAWLDEHNIPSINDVRGRMSHGKLRSPSSLERVNYIQTLRSYYDD